MITFNKDDYVFVYRVAGVAIHDNNLLVHKSILDDFWSLPGGRCEFLEISKDTLKREMNEEIGVDIKIYIYILRKISLITWRRIIMNYLFSI